MAVYTTLDAQAISEVIAPFDIGRLHTFSGISEGIENSNYLVMTENLSSSGAVTTRAEYVLTIAESQTPQDIAFIVELTTLLHDRGLPVPKPLSTKHGTQILLVQGKPAVLVPKIAGHHPVQPNVSQCQAIGSTLGQFHAVTQATGLARESHRNLGWATRLGRELQPHLSSPEQDLMARGLQACDRIARLHTQLPTAIIHGDLFRDNTLFEGDQLNAVIDFFSAGMGFLLFDLAVVANDWATDDQGRPHSAKTQALLTGYATARCPQDQEKLLWPDFLCAAALRFWVSRLTDSQRRLQNADSPCLAAIKDPDQYKTILDHHLFNPSPWPL